MLDILYSERWKKVHAGFSVITSLEKVSLLFLLFEKGRLLSSLKVSSLSVFYTAVRKNPHENEKSVVPKQPVCSKWWNEPMEQHQQKWKW